MPMLHRTLLKLSNPDSGLPWENPRGSKWIRGQLAACHLVTGRHASIATRVDTSEQEVLQMLQHGGHIVVVWVDHFNKAQDSKNPATRRDISLSTTAMALIPASSLRAHFAGRPTPNALLADVTQDASDINDLGLLYQLYATTGALGHDF